MKCYVQRVSTPSRDREAHLNRTTKSLSQPTTQTTGTPHVVIRIAQQSNAMCLVLDILDCSGPEFNFKSIEISDVFNDGGG